jgi:hypothetical protein
MTDFEQAQRSPEAPSLGAKRTRVRNLAAGKPERLSGLQRQLAFLFLAPWALDFRAEVANGGVGGNVFQFLILAISLFSAIALIATTKSGYRHQEGWRRLMTLWAVFMVYSVVAGTLQGVAFSHLIRILLPFGLCMIGMAVGAILAMDARNLDALVLWIGVTAIVSEVWTAVYALLEMGLTFDTVRYRILSSLIVYLIAVPACIFIYGQRKHMALSVAGFVLAGASVLLSQTRTELIVVFAVVGVLFWYYRGHKHLATQRTARRAGKKSRLLPKVLAAVVLVVISGVVAIKANPDILDEFASRIMAANNAQGDATALTRIAEGAGEIEAMRRSPSTMLFGLGLGSDHSWDVSYIIDIAADQGEDTDVWYPGHIGWLYQFYASGLLFGWVLPFVFLITIRNGWRSSNPLFGAVVVCVFFAYMFQGFLAHPMGSRAGAVACGLMIGAAAVKPADKRNAVEPGRAK